MSDTLIAPAVSSLLQCLCEALNDVYAADPENRPRECCYRVGEAVSADASAYEDLCCSGLAWARLAGIFPASDEFPNPDTDTIISPCGIQAWGATIEIGVLRCAPTGSATSIPTCGQWTDLFDLVTRDSQAMRQAFCCWIPQFETQSVALGSWTPLATSGGCAGGSWEVTVQIINDCQDC